MPSQYLVDPTGYTTLATGARVSTPKPIESLYNIMRPAEIADLVAGDYARVTLGTPPPQRPLGSYPIKFRGPTFTDMQTAWLRGDKKVGGSSTLTLNGKQGKLGACDVEFARLGIEGDDRSALYTEKGGIENVTFDRCRIAGIGSMLDPNWGGDPKLRTKWGARLYDVKNLKFLNCTGGEVWEEHWFYDEGSRGDKTFDGFDIRHCGRTAIQDVSRPPPDGTAVSVGDVFVRNGKIVDVALGDQGGGSAIHIAGGAPTKNWLIEGVDCELGCDPDLPAPWNKNITGFISCKRGTPPVNPGGSASLRIHGCSSKVGVGSGSFAGYPGVAGARRTNVDVWDVDLFEMRDTFLQQGPKAQQIALEIHPTVKEVRIGRECEVIGEIRINGRRYLNWSAFLADPMNAAIIV